MLATASQSTLQLLLQRGERITNRDVDVFMLSFPLALADDKLVVGNAQVNRNLKVLPFMVVLMRPFDYHTATQDVRMLLLQLVELARYEITYAWGSWDSAKNNLQFA